MPSFLTSPMRCHYVNNDKSLVLFSPAASTREQHINVYVLKAAMTKVVIRFTYVIILYLNTLNDVLHQQPSRTTTDVLMQKSFPFFFFFLYLFPAANRLSNRLSSYKCAPKPQNAFFRPWPGFGFSALFADSCAIFGRFLLSTKSGGGEVIL